MIAVIFAIFAFSNAAFSLKYSTVTGPTPPPCSVQNSQCNNKADGNYEYRENGVGPVIEEFFLQCSNGLAYCQPCWPQTLKFSEDCNQCLYNKNDPCHTTKSWSPTPTFHCPDLCPSRGPDFNGNMADPSERRHYIGCWEGVTVGCVQCPEGLLFNETWNACLYFGMYKTFPQHLLP